MTNSEAYFQENVVNNVKEIKEIGNLAIRAISDSFNIEISIPLAMTCYAITYDCILDILKKKEKTYKRFGINICNILSISYDNDENDENEKLGNFMINISNIKTGGNVYDKPVDTDDRRTEELCVQWNASNVKDQPDIIKEICALADSRLRKNLNLRTSSNGLIMPIFCTTHEQIISYMRLKRADLGVTSYELDIMGLYDIIISESDDGDEVIEYMPQVYSKLALKDDNDADTSDDIGD